MRIKMNYLRYLNETRSVSKFNMIYESIMKDLDIYSGITAAKTISNNELNLILEQINTPQYLICESSGREILLEEAIFMEENYLISEGIFETVGKKIEELINYIKDGIKKVLSAASDVIKAFCEKVKENKVVQAIRKKLNLDEKLKAENFKKFVKIKSKDKETAVESVLETLDTFIITEATTLSKKEQAITDPKELEALIKKWEDSLSGKAPLKNKKGEPLSKKYSQEKLNLLKKKLKSLTSDEKTEKTAGDKNKPIGDIHISTERYF